MAKLTGSFWPILIALANFFHPRPIAAQQSFLRLEVDNAQVVSSNFLGVNAVYHGFSYMQEADSIQLTSAQREREFQRIKTLGLKIARTWYRPDWSCKTDLYGDYDWQSARMKSFCQWLDRMQLLKVDIALQAGWWFTRDTYFGRSAPDPEKDPTVYAKWVASSMHYLIKVKGYTNIKYLVLFTEPLNYEVGLIPRGFTEPAYYAKVCREIHLALKANGLRSAVKLVGPNSGSTDTAAHVKWSVENLNDIVDIYSWHTYNGATFNTNPPKEYEGWSKITQAGLSLMQATGKPFWIDEYGANRPSETVRHTPDYGNYLAQSVAAFINQGAQTSLLWILFDQKYPSLGTTNDDSFRNGIHRWGLVRHPNDNISGAGKPHPAYYAFQLMSKHLGGGDGTRVFKTEGTDSLYIVATGREQGLSVMVVNGSRSAKNFCVHFKKNTNGKFTRFLYDPESIKVSNPGDEIVADKTFRATAFKDRIPPRGVAIYTTDKNL